MKNHQKNENSKCIGNECVHCFGKKKCPLDRDYCSQYFPCLEEFILRKLKLGWGPIAIRKEVIEIAPFLSDQIILQTIGRVAKRNGYYFSYRKVNRTIQQSSIPDAPEREIQEEGIRRAFGVYGREGRRNVRKVCVRNTDGVKTPGEAHPGPEA